MKTLLISLFLFLFIPSRKDVKILFIGDSLTCYSNGWQHTVAKGMGMGYVNISKVGKRTDWMLKTLENYLENGPHHNTLIIYGGINDSFARTSEITTINNIQSMVNLGNLYEMEVIVIVGYDPNKVIKKTVYTDNVTKVCRDRYVKLQNKMQERLLGCKIIPMDTTVTYQDSGDGIHLKSSGHKKFSSWVLKNL
jgi:lysophospholipase L1-like esterase